MRKNDQTQSLTPLEWDRLKVRAITLGTTILGTYSAARFTLQCASQLLSLAAIDIEADTGLAPYLLAFAGLCYIGNLKRRFNALEEKRFERLGEEIGNSVVEILEKGNISAPLARSLATCLENAIQNTRTETNPAEPPIPNIIT